MKTIDKYAKLKRFHHDRPLKVYIYDFMYIDPQTMPAEDYIIIHSSSFEDFLFIKIILYKGKTKVYFIVICYRELKQTKKKNPIKYLNTDAQVK